ncbi:MAG TPA: autotransporter-associated beta strand repeat-containing protein, partial [Dyella sp.]
MNRIYRLVWNRALHVCQVASELSSQQQGGLSAHLGCGALATGPQRRLVMALALAMPWLSSTVYAACTPANPTAGATVTCSGAANPLAPSYSTSANNLTVNVQSGGSTGVLLGIGGTAMTLTGNNTTLNNSGTIDPSLLGLLSLLSSGTVVGNSAASTVNVTNTSTGVMNGTSGLLGVNLSGLTGMALAVQNGTGGVSNIRNDGSIGGAAIAGVTLIPSDIPVVAAYGGGQVNFVNTGTINGRVGFQASGTAGTGNSFANAGTINGGVSMGINSTNTFTAVSGSSVNLAGGVGLDLNVIGLVGVTLGFAPTGVIDGGAGGNNTLVLQNVLPSAGTGSGTGGAVTTLSSGTYINFQHLLVNSGTWNLQGPLVSGDATLNGGLVNFNNGGVFGAGAVSANGGAIGASTGGVTLGNNFTLGAGGVTAAGANNFTLSGVLSGTGGLTQNGSGITTLSGANTYTGATTIAAGTLALGSTGSLLSTGAVNLSGATGTFDISGTSAGSTIGTLTGVAGSQVALGARSLTLGNAANTSYAGSINGTGGLVKQGTGTFSLSGANTYTGGTTVNAGTLAVTGGGSLASTGAVSLAAASALDISGATANQTVGNLTGASGSQVLLGARTLTAGNAGNTTFGGVISGSGGFVKQGSGTLILTGANTYTGGTTINAGALQGDTVSLQGSIIDNSTLIFNQTTDGTYANAITGTGNLVKQGAATLILTGANTYSGGTVISAGTLQGDSTSLQGNMTDNAALVFNQAADGTYAGNISGTGSFTKTGAGTLTLSGTNAYTGGTTVNAGTLQGTTASLTGAIVDNATLAFNQASNGTYAGAISGTGSLTKLGSGTVTLSGANTYTGGTTITAGALQGDTTSLQGNVVDNASLIFGQDVDGTYAGVISGSGSLTKAGAGTLTLGGANTYTGGTTISAGALQINTGSLVGNIVDNASLIFNQPTDSTYAGVVSGTGSLTKTGAGILTLSGANTYSGGTTISAGALQGDTTSLQGNIVDNASLIFAQAANGSFAGIVSGSGALIKNGTGTLTLSGANTYTGGTTINAGALQGDATSLQGNITDNASLIFNQAAAGTYAGVISGTGTLAKTGAGTLTLSGANTYGGGTTISAGALQGNATSLQGNITDNASLIFNQATAGTYAGVVSGTGSLTKTGAGTLTLSGANTYAGGTTVSAGTLQGDVTSLQGNIFDNATLAFNQVADGSYAGVVSGSGALVKLGAATLTLTGANTYSGGTTISAGTLQGNATSLQGNIVDNATLAFNQGTDASYAGVVSGNGALVKLGAGTLTLTGANTYTGGTTITAGALQGDSTSLQGNIADNASLIFNQTATGSYGGVVSGTGSLTKTGAGTLSLTGANTYRGGTTVSAGTLQGNSASLQGNIVDNASLAFNQVTDGTYAGVVSGTGSLTKLGAGTLTLSGANTYAGGTTISAGTLQGNTTSLQGNIVDNATLAFNQATDGSYAGVVSGSGALVKLGAGALTLTGANTYAGGTTITAGALQGDATSLQGNIADNASLIFNQGVDGTYAGVVSGTGNLTKTGAGTLTLSGANVYSGGTTISAGALQGDTTSLQGNIADNASLIFNQVANGTYAGVVSGTGSLTKTGAGILTLSGANTYSGGTTISAGALQGDTTSLQGNITDNATLIFNQGANGSYTGVVSGSGDLVKLGVGTLTLAGVNTYTGATQINAGTLALGAGGSMAASSSISLATGSTLDLSAAGNQTLSLLNGAGGTVNLGANALTLDGAGTGNFGGALTGTGSLVMQGTGTQTLTGVNLYTGGTTVNSGTLALGAGGSLAAGSAVTVNGGTLDLSAAGNQTIANLGGAGGQVQLGGGSALTVDAGTFAGALGGNGSLIKAGAGVLVLNGANTYTGPTQVVSGSLVVGGDAAHNTAGIQSDVTVAATGSLGGFGHVDGNVDVLSGGHLAPGNPPGTFTVNGNLSLEQGSQLDFALGAPGADFNTFGSSHNVQVNGDLTLNGAVLNPSDAGGFGPGLYNLFDYTGTLTQANGGIVAPSGYTIQNLTGSKQINLINAAGISLNIWNANGLASATQMGGGSGVWSQANANWTNADGSVTAARSPADAFVIFGGAAGTVTVDDAGGTQPVTTQGIQFASDGYHLNGDALGLVAPSAGALSEIRVGDGSAASAGWTATIDNVLTGNGLQKTGAGTLILTGANTYAQGTELSAGTLSVSSDANLGAGSGTIDFEGGVLQITGTGYTSTTRGMTLGAAGGGFDIADPANTFTVNQALSGTGSLTKLGTGTLVLSGANTYSGGTTVSAGTLQGDSTSLQGNITDNASLVFDQGADGTYAGVVSGTGSLTKDGAGTLTLSGANTYSGGTTINAGALQGDTTSLQGNIADNASLIFNQGADGTYAGAVSGTGSL